MNDKLQLVINDIKDEIELVTLYSNDGVSKSAKWYLDMHVKYLQKVVDNLESII